MSKKLIVKLPSEIKENLHEMVLDTEHKGDVADYCLSILKNQASNIKTVIRAKKINGVEIDIKRLLNIQVNHIDKPENDDIIIKVSDLTFGDIENVYRLQKYQMEEYPLTFDQHISAMIEITIGPKLSEFYKKQMDKADEEIDKTE